MVVVVVVVVVVVECEVMTMKTTSSERAFNMNTISNRELEPFLQKLR